MTANPILKEIRQTRDTLAEETDMALRSLFATARQQEKSAKPAGRLWFPSPPASIVRDEPQ